MHLQWRTPQYKEVPQRKLKSCLFVDSMNSDSTLLEMLQVHHDQVIVVTDRHALAAHEFCYVGSEIYTMKNEPRVTLTFTASLASGATRELSVAPNSFVGDLQVAAEKAFEQGPLSLASTDCQVLDSRLHLSAVPLRGGEHLTAVMSGHVELCSTVAAFVMYTKGQHGIYCWGSEKLGQVANRIPEQLREVEVHFVAATDYAFAAVNEHGRVITWGDRRYGGDSRHVQDQLVDVEEIQGTEGAFAAKRKDGQVILWGARHKGGSTRQDRLKEIQTIRSTTTAFAAITQDGHVIAWGDPDKGGDSRYVDDELEDVQEIVGTDAAFAALRKDGHVITWGHDRYGGDTRYIRDQLTNVKSIQATGSAFAAIRKDGSVVSWGNPSCGGDTFDVQDQLYDVNFIKGTKVAFAAIRADGTVIAWGDGRYGGDTSTVADQLKDVQTLSSTDLAFAAVRANGTVVTWGDRFSGGKMDAEVKSQLVNVQKIHGSSTAFAAILSNRKLVTWGDNEAGGQSEPKKHWHRKTGSCWIDPVWMENRDMYSCSGTLVALHRMEAPNQLPRSQLQINFAAADQVAKVEFMVTEVSHTEFEVQVLKERRSSRSFDEEVYLSNQEYSNLAAACFEPPFFDASFFWIFP
eukprot:symbB.v1.2.035566.t1/scaffold4822.1/size34315/4